MLAHITLTDLPVMAALATVSFALGGAAFALGRRSAHRGDSVEVPPAH